MVMPNIGLAKTIPTLLSRISIIWIDHIKVKLTNYYNDTLMTLGLVVFGRFIVLKAIIEPILSSFNFFKKITKKLFNQLL